MVLVDNTSRNLLSIQPRFDTDLFRYGSSLVEAYGLKPSRLVSMSIGGKHIASFRDLESYIGIADFQVLGILRSIFHDGIEHPLLMNSLRELYERHQSSVSSHFPDYSGIVYQGNSFAEVFSDVVLMHGFSTNGVNNVSLLSSKIKYAIERLSKRGNLAQELAVQLGDNRTSQVDMPEITSYFDFIESNIEELAQIVLSRLVALGEYITQVIHSEGLDLFRVESDLTLLDQFNSVIYRGNDENLNVRSIFDLFLKINVNELAKRGIIPPDYGHEPNQPQNLNLP